VGHSATPKNGSPKVDSKARGRTTEAGSRYGKGGKIPAGGNNSKLNRSSSAGK
jgi:hypothetical protein